MMTIFKNNAEALLQIEIKEVLLWNQEEKKKIIWETAEKSMG